MIAKDLEDIILVCKKHHVLAVEVSSKGGVKVQFYPVPIDPSAAVPPPQTEEPPAKAKEPAHEDVMAALHLGGGRG